MIPTVKPYGIADLLVIKQRLIRYQPGEVAHIENVLESERRMRSHRRLRQVETQTVRVAEREEESRRDLQSTERFELENEVQKTVMSETAFQAGVELSGGYGPVKVTAYARVSDESSVEESETNAVNYAKEVVDKSMTRLLERVRTERRIRTLEEVEELNEHEFNNIGIDNIVGVYRWVDKVYRQKLINYGSRLMYQFVIPEPASFLSFSEQQRLQNHILPTKPVPPTIPGSTEPLTPSAIDRANWKLVAQESGASNLRPPPPERIRVSKSIARDTSAGTHWSFANEDLDIPPGYIASAGSYKIWYTSLSDEPHRTILVGLNRISIGLLPALSFHGEVARVPISGTGFNIESFILNLEIECELNAFDFETWQTETYDAVMNVYRASLIDYEDRLAAAQVRMGLDVGDADPATNRRLEQDELKRSCIYLWAGPSALAEEAVVQAPGQPTPANYPRIERQVAIENSLKISFFENAFDWTNMSYDLHPYSWGRESEWIDLLALESDDPAFERFLRAGAATVMVPVRPAFTEAVLWYQLTGEIWPGGPVPSLDSTGSPDASIYNSYLAELEVNPDVTGLDNQFPIEENDPDSWEVVIPTTLVWLQEDPDLPSFPGPGS